MKQLNRNTGLKFAVVLSLICHILMFASVELTFGKRIAKSNFDFTKIFFLGPILQKVDYSRDSAQGVDGSVPFTISPEYNRRTGGYARLNTEVLAGMLKPEFPEPDKLISDLIILKKPRVANLIDNKITYFKPIPVLKAKKTHSSIMFYPLMPYHFLLYFKNQQTAHMEVAFYISPEGKIVGLRRKISSGNPEVDLLIMRNLIHFLNLCKSNFAVNSWQTVKIDLRP